MSTIKMQLDEDRAPSPAQGILVKQAWQAWQDAIAYFNAVTEPELLEYAAYAIETARRKYLYLLGQARLEYDEAQATLRLAPVSQ